MNNLSGSTLGQYQLIERIGKGGMATVYRAYQSSVDRHVAIKVLSPDLADEAEFIARFEREARIIAGLQHPHILAVHDFGRQDRLAYLVMRLMEGGSLDDELRDGHMVFNRVFTLTEQIAAALDYAHQRGIVHRDLKPSNVLLDKLGNAALTDFGIAKLLASGTIAGLTVPGAVMGTPTYMAPEQWRSEAVDGRVDIYALGILIYQMLSDQVPFTADTPHGLMYQHLDVAPPSLHQIKPELPPTVDPVLLKALAKNREDRYAAAGELAHELTQALRQQPTLSSRRSILPAPDTRRDDHSATCTHAGGEKGARFRTSTHTTIPTAPVPPAQSIPPPQQLRPASHIPTSPSYRQRASTPIVTGYTVPYRSPDPYPEHINDDAYNALSLGAKWRHLIRSLVVVIVVLGGLIVIGLVVALLFSSDDQQAENKLPTLPRITDTPVSQGPAVTILSPSQNEIVAVGDTVMIEFVASNTQGISHIELRHFNTVLDTIFAEGQTTIQSTFAYPANNIGFHNLEVVSWNGAIAGPGARITFQVR